MSYYNSNIDFLDESDSDYSDNDSDDNDINIEDKNYYCCPNQKFYIDSQAYKLDIPINYSFLIDDNYNCCNVLGCELWAIDQKLYLMFKFNKSDKYLIYLEDFKFLSFLYYYKVDIKINFISFFNPLKNGIVKDATLYVSELNKYVYCYQLTITLIKKTISDNSVNNIFNNPNNNNFKLSFDL